MKPCGELLASSAEAHGHLCPGQVGGVRTAMLGCRLIGLDDPTHPQQIKRLIVYTTVLDLALPRVLVESTWARRSWVFSAMAASAAIAPSAAIRTVSSAKECENPFLKTGGITCSTPRRRPRTGGAWLASQGTMIRVDGR